MKKRSKKKSSEEKSALPDNVIPLPGLGGPLSGTRDGISPEISKFEMEKMMGSIGKMLEGQDFDSTEEMNEFLDSKLKGMLIDDIISQTPTTPEEEAQNYAYDASGAETIAEAREYIARALELDPYCIEALRSKAELEAETDKEYVERLQEIAAIAEKRFGKKYMKENKGHFWGMLETRPYMRLRQDIVCSFIEMDETRQAIGECETMLELNPNDNQGMRDLLRMLYLENDDYEGVRRLNKRYDESTLAIAAWSALLERYLKGDLEQAETLARGAHKQNKHVVRYLLGKKRIPKEGVDYYSIGDKNEAIICAQGLIKVLLKHPEAIKWLKQLKLR